MCDSSDSEEEEGKCITNRKMFATVLKRLTKAEGIISILVVNENGLVWYTTMNNELTALRYCRVYKPFCMRTTSLCRNVDTEDDVKSIMISTRKHEMLLIPDDEFILIALQRCGVGESLYPEFKEGDLNADVKIT